MTRVTYYFDENRMAHSLLAACAGLGLDCLAAREAGMLGRSDTDQLTFATAIGRVLVTENARDFLRLHVEWMERGHNHSGILIASQQRRRAPGAQARALLALAESLTAEEMVNRVDSLRRWLEQV